MYFEEHLNENLEASDNLSSVSASEQPGIDYSVDFIYGSDQSQYLQQQVEGESGLTAEQTNKNP